MAGDGGYRGVVDGGISRGRFLKLAGLGAGLSLFPGSLFPAGPGAAQAVGTPPELLDPTRYPYPIVAWWPPPPVSNDLPDAEVNAETARRYAELAGAGFNAAIGGNGVGNERANRLALAACERPDVDVRLVLADAELSKAIGGTTTTANRADITRRLNEIYSGIEGRPGFGGRTGLAGIFLYDEPGRTKFADLRFARQKVEEIFGPDELPYVNAWPSYADPESALQAPSYTDYLGAYMNGEGSESSPFLSFDHYPLLADEKTTPDFFYNHAVIRRFAQDFGVPSWGFVQSMGFSGGKVGIGRRRPPDEAEIFWQINVALAYGVKGIQYFTYWTPNDPDLQSGDALITLAGERTARYGYARDANEFLRKVGGVLLPLTSVSVTHFGERRLPRGAKAFRGDSYVKAASGDPAILGSFSDPNVTTDRYVLVVNRSPNQASRTRLTITSTVRSVERFDPSIGPSGEFVTETLAGDPPRSFTATSDPGRAVLYRLRTA